MYINDQNLSALSLQLSNSSSASSTKSLADYMNESDSDEGSSYFSDSVSLSAEAYAAIREYNPEMLKTLGLKEENSDTLLANSSGSALDSFQLSTEAYSALKETNPELLEALGYSIEE